MPNEDSIDRLLLSNEETEKRVAEWMKKIEECKKNGHPELVVVSYYRPRNPRILEKCTYCDLFVERDANSYEIQSYHNLLRSTIRI